MKQFHRMLLILASVFALSTTFIVFTPQIALAANQATMAISCPATISYGSQGPLVKQLQQTLNDDGFPGQDGNALVVDGIFGSNTQFAVENFQSIAAPPADGIVGPKTWHALGYCG